MHSQDPGSFLTANQSNTVDFCDVMAGCSGPLVSASDDKNVVRRRHEEAVGFAVYCHVGTQRAASRHVGILMVSFTFFAGVLTGIAACALVVWLRRIAAPRTLPRSYLFAAAALAIFVMAAGVLYVTLGARH